MCPTGCVFLVLLLVVAVSVHAQDLPSLPNAFSATVEANFVENGRSLFFREDAILDKELARIDTFAGNNPISFLADELKNVTYTWNPNTRSCNVSHPQTNPFENPDGSIRSPSQLFLFGSEFDEQYQGQERARGILCDVWLSSFNLTIPVGPTQALKQSGVLTFTPSTRFVLKLHVAVFAIFLNLSPPTPYPLPEVWNLP